MSWQGNIIQIYADETNGIIAYRIRIGTNTYGILYVSQNETYLQYGEGANAPRVRLSPGNIDLRAATVTAANLDHDNITNTHNLTTDISKIVFINKSGNHLTINASVPTGWTDLTPRTPEPAIPPTAKAVLMNIELYSANAGTFRADIRPSSSYGDSYAFSAIGNRLTASSIIVPGSNQGWCRLDDEKIQYRLHHTGNGSMSLAIKYIAYMC